jgi:hypothetical protein
MAACAVFSTFAQADANADRLEKNRQTVLTFYDLAINQKDFDAAEKFMGSKYI